MPIDGWKGRFNLFARDFAWWSWVDEVIVDETEIGNDFFIYLSYVVIDVVVKSSISFVTGFFRAALKAISNSK